MPNLVRAYEGNPSAFHARKSCACRKGAHALMVVWVCVVVVVGVCCGCAPWVLSWFATFLYVGSESLFVLIALGSLIVACVVFLFRGLF